MDEVASVRHFPGGTNNQNLQVLFEQDPHYFITQLNQSLLNATGDFGASLKSENYKFIQITILERLQSDASFAENYLLLSLDSLCLLGEPIDPKYHEFLARHLSDQDSRIRTCIFRLISDQKITISSNEITSALQGEILGILNGGDNTGLQSAVEAATVCGINNFRVLLNGALQQFRKKLDELARQATVENWPQRTYLANAMQTLRPFAT